MTIVVKYSCDGCGLKRVDVVVDAREPKEDLMAWLDRLRLALSSDHRRRSPSCDATSMQEVLIPIVGTNAVGAPTVQ